MRATWQKRETHMIDTEHRLHTPLCEESRPAGHQTSRQGKRVEMMSRVSVFVQRPAQPSRVCGGPRSVSRLCLVRMLLRDAGLRRHGIAAPLLLGDVVLVGEGLLLLDRLRHVARVHLRVALGDAGAGLLRGEVLRAGLLGRLDGAGIVDAVLTTAGGLGGVQAGLGRSISDARRVLGGRGG